MNLGHAMYGHYIYANRPLKFPAYRLLRNVVAPCGTLADAGLGWWMLLIYNRAGGVRA